MHTEIQKESNTEILKKMVTSEHLNLETTDGQWMTSGLHQ
jgi:hypothetical protein